MPTISSFSPQSGKQGDTVTISGANFGDTVGANSVFFGAVKAIPISASTTSIEVQVPGGATYAPVSVQVTGGNSAQSDKPFIPTFSPGGPVTNYSFGQATSFFPPSSWPPLVSLTAGLSGPTQGALIADFDGDGKPDVAVANWNTNNVVVFRNAHVSGNLTASSLISAATLAVGSRPTDIAVGDLNGDGLPDLVVANNNDSTLSFLQNSSTLGAISFSPAVTVTLPFPYGLPSCVKLADIDGDGWLDVIVGRDSPGIFRNKALGGILTASSFQSLVVFTVSGGGAYDLAVGDVDGDHKPDLLVTGYPGKISILRNTATPGTIDAGSFATPLQLTTSSTPTAVLLADLNADGKAEIIVGTPSSTLSIFPNASTPGSLTVASFGARVDLQISQNSQYALNLSVADLNGDGKPDILVANRFDPGVFVAVNGGTASIAAAFTSFVGLNIPAGDAGSGMYGHVAIGDLNADGRPDLVVDGEFSKLEICENFVCPLTVSSFAISPATSNVTVPWYRVRNFAAIQIMSDGSSIDVTPASAWTTSNPAVATVTTSGRVSGVGSGQTIITASYQGAEAQATVTVLPNSFGTNPGNPDGRFLPDIANAGASGAVKAFAVQTDGKVIVGGDFSSINGIARQNLARLNDDGSVDPTFDPGSGPNGSVEGLALDANNEVIIVGRFTSVAGITRNYIARITSGGAVDSGFNANFLASSSLRANVVQVLANGLILVGGNALRVAGDSNSTFLLRLDATGAKDPSFSANPVSSGELNALAVQTDGKLVVGGSFLGTGAMGLFCLARLDMNGTFDPGFSRGITSSRVYDIALQQDGKIVVVGDFSSIFGNTIHFITRLNADGTLDGAFTSPATTSWGIISAVAVQKNGKIIVSKFVETVRLTPSGAIDASYNATVHPDWAPSRIFVAPDEKIWISGGVTTVNGYPTMGLARLHGDVTTFLGWQTRYFSREQLSNTSMTGPDGDAVGDGVENLLKYAFGLDPRNPATGQLPRETCVTDGIDSYIQFTYQRLRLATDLICKFGISFDLQTWDYSGADVEQVGIPAVSADGLTEEVTVRWMTPVQDADRAFLRLQFNRTP